MPPATGVPGGTRTPALRELPNWMLDLCITGLNDQMTVLVRSTNGLASGRCGGIRSEMGEAALRAEG